MRLVSTTLVAAAVVVAFVAGHATGSQPSQIALAQMQPAASTAPAAIDGSNMPGNFSHFKCYQTSVRLPRPALVNLYDQFGQSRMQLTFADLFCTPVKKVLVGSKPLPVPGPADHLLCYRGEAPSVNQTRNVYNQLQRTKIQITLPRYLCVPTFKQQVPIPGTQQKM